MISADEIDVLQEAFFRAENSNVSRREYFAEDLQDYISFLGIERDILPDLHDYFEIREDTRCERHRTHIDSCGCSNSRTEQVKIYTLNTDALINDWYEAIIDQDIFEDHEKTKISNTRWELIFWLGRTEVTFQCFFDRREFRNYDFTPSALEFGVSFFGSDEIVEKDYCYVWSEFLDEGFEDRITGEVKRIREAIGADFYEYEPISDFRDRVRQCLREYFEESGYDVRREVGEVCAVETTRYGIDTGKTDFVGSNDESKYIVCHCSKSPGWHIHHFIDGRIESAEQTPLVEDMMGKIETKINAYKDIIDDKQTASRFVNVLATFFSLGFVVLLFDRLGSVTPILSNQLPNGTNLEILVVVLLLLNAIAAIALAAVIVRPYYRDYKFKWEIEPFED